MKSIVLVSLCCLAASAAIAGPNAGGTLVVHDPSVGYTFDGACSAGIVPSSCLSVDTDLDGSNSTDQRLWKIYAAFDSHCNPRLTVVTFGISYTPGVEITAFGHCGDAELPGFTWPAPGAGSQVAWNTPQTAHMIEVYWFWGYSTGGTSETFGVTANPDPNLGGNFADDTVSAVLDPIAGYGILGFDNELGVAPCTPIAVCCDQITGNCSLTPQCSCVLPSTWYAGLTACTPNPCVLGGCCCHDFVERWTNAIECTEIGCEWLGAGVVPNPANCPPIGCCCCGIDHTPSTQADCNPSGGCFWLAEPCTKLKDGCSAPPVPVEHRSWGRIKAAYGR